MVLRTPCDAGFWALEVKNAARGRPGDLTGPRGFAEEYPECTPILLYRGFDRLRTGGIWCVPVEEFLPQLRPDRRLFPTEKADS